MTGDKDFLFVGESRYFFENSTASFLCASNFEMVSVRRTGSSLMLAGEQPRWFMEENLFPLVSPFVRYGFRARALDSGDMVATLSSISFVPYSWSYEFSTTCPSWLATTVYLPSYPSLTLGDDWDSPFRLACSGEVCLRTFKARLLNSNAVSYLMLRFLAESWLTVAFF